MRSTAVSQSGMPSGKAYIGWWGSMGGPQQKGVVTYQMSPFRQRPFAGVFQGYIFNGYSRIMKQVPYFVLPFAVGYGVYKWAGDKYAYYNSKEGHHAIAVAEGHAH